MMSCSLSASDKTNGRWTKQQHQNFLLGLQMYGKNWKKIQELIGTRNGSQIRSHAQKFFLKFKKTYSNEQNSDVAQQIQRDNQTVNSKFQEEIETKYSDYSYFLEKIVHYSTNKGKFDFWQTLIDHQQNHISQPQQEQKSRKNSFVSFDDQESQIQNLSSPQKKVKN